MFRLALIACLIPFATAWSPVLLEAQHLAGLRRPAVPQAEQACASPLPGTTLRFTQRTTVAWRDPEGRVIRTTEERQRVRDAVLVAAEGDTLTAEVDGRLQRIPLTSVSNIQVQCPRDPGEVLTRGFLRGAVAGATVGLVLGLCNPSLFGDGGCEGGLGGGELFQIAATTALASSAAGAILAVLFEAISPSEGWREIPSLEATPASGQEGWRVSLTLPVG